MNPLKIFIFCAAAAVAALGTAYFTGAFDRARDPEPAPVAAAPDPAVPTAASPQPQDAASAGRPAADAAEDEPAGGPQAAAETIAPSFDLLRVDPDGSIVIAGTAAPSSSVEIVAGASTLGTTKAGASGDFAIVLDEPLKPGEHQLVLRMTAADNTVATSSETAVVSIPDQPGGQVLALVEAPGKPSTLITVPKPQPPAPAASAAPPADGGEAAADQDAGDQDVARQDAGEGAAAPEAAPSGQAAAETTPQERPAATPEPQVARIAVEAVEIEGRRIFVAGSAEPGRTIRIYANDQLLGETRAAPNGRFLVETERDLPVGDYIIRADMLAPNGADVLARAAVPFEREAGETIAAMAPQQPAPPSGSAESEASAAGMARPEASDAPEEADGTSGQIAAAEPEAGASPAGTGDEALAPKLEKVEGAVIIRRGDSLWRISRRVYGRGIRYSTIYLANQDQIADPNRIWPGQVFRVPEKTEAGEAADMDAVRDQATTRTVQ